MNTQELLADRDFWRDEAKRCYKQIEEYKMFLKRIEELQEFMHGTSKLAFNLDEAGIVEQPEEKKGFFLAMLIFSHALEDVLDGKDVAEAVGDAIFQDEDKD